MWYLICHYYGPESRATMYTMTRSRRVSQSRPAFGVFCLVLSLGLSQGCARSQPSHRTETSSQEAQEAEDKLPFHPETDHASASDRAHPAVSLDPKAAPSLPFRTVSHPRILPPGTLMTVQLEAALSTSRVRAGDAFTATVAAPLTIDGDTLIERGTAVTGRVESAQPQVHRLSSVPGSGYFRLTLSAITVAGRQLALQTSSLFTRGSFQPSNASSRSGSLELTSGGVQVQKGRRLTFRLTAPVTLDDPNSVAKGQYSSPTTE
jgi:hypothetical protein